MGLLTTTKQYWITAALLFEVSRQAIFECSTLKTVHFWAQPIHISCFYYWKPLERHPVDIHLVVEEAVGNNKTLNREEKEGREIFCGLIAWQRCSSGTDVPTNLICDAAWCEDLWVVVTRRGRREINDTQTDNCTSEAPTQQHREKKAWISSSARREELMLWKREGMRIYSRAAYCVCLNWYDGIANPHLVCIYATNTR